MNLKEEEKCFNAYEKALSISPLTMQFYSSWGLSCQNFQKWELAIDKFQKAIKYDNTSVFPYYGLSVSYLKLRLDDEAYKIMQKILELDPEHTITLYNCGQYFFKRKLVKTASNSCANTELEKVTLTKNADWYKYVNDDEYIIVWRGCNVKIKYKDYFGNTLSEEMITGNLGERYETTPKNIDGYDVISVPTNSSGTYTEQDITVEYKYDLKNVAKVTFEDLLSGVVSAKYWYNDNNNQFSGNGTDFTNGTVFERYGNYKVVVVNSVGLEKELTFTLNKDSLVR